MSRAYWKSIFCGGLHPILDNKITGPTSEIHARDTRTNAIKSTNFYRNSSARLLHRESSADNNYIPFMIDLFRTAALKNIIIILFMTLLTFLTNRQGRCFLHAVEETTTTCMATYILKYVTQCTFKSQQMK